MRNRLIAILVYFQIMAVTASTVVADRPQGLFTTSNDSSYYVFTDQEIIRISVEAQFAVYIANAECILAETYAVSSNGCSEKWGFLLEGPGETRKRFVVTPNRVSNGDFVAWLDARPATGAETYFSLRKLNELDSTQQLRAIRANGLFFFSGDSESIQKRMRKSVETANQ